MTNGGIEGNTPVCFEAQGASAQVWWKVLTIEGLLTDVIALSGLTYRPDLN